MSEGPNGSIYQFPKTPHANDNKDIPNEPHPGLQLDRVKEGELQLVFNRHREENPRVWTEEKLEEYRKRLSIVADKVLIARFNESTPHEWNVDPRYFFIVLERMNSPIEIDE